MRSALIKGLLALTGALFLITKPAFGEMSRVDLCNAYADEALKIAGRVRELTCGFDLGHPQWSQNRSDHFNWCVDAKVETIDHERDERRNKLSRCGECREYATFAAFQGRLNDELKCGFSGPRWSRDQGPHFGWCMDLEAFVPSSTWHPFVIFGASPVYEPSDDKRLSHEDGARSQAIEECRLKRQKPQNCKSCHGGSSQVSSAQDVYRALSPSKSGKPSPASRPVTTARKPSGSSGVDTVNPSKPKPRIVAPGLLEGDSGFGAQGPAGAGTAVGGGGAGGGGAGGGGVGASTFRGTPNMVAPPAGGGLR